MNETKRKQEMFKTAKFHGFDNEDIEGKFVAIIGAMENGDGTWRYSIRLMGGTVQAQVDEKHLSRFCL